MRAANWNPMVEELRSGQPVDLTGASGPLDFDLGSEELPGVVQIWEIEEPPSSPYELSVIYEVD